MNGVGIFWGKGLEMSFTLRVNTPVIAMRIAGKNWVILGSIAVLFSGLSADLTGQIGYF